MAAVGIEAPIAEAPTVTNATSAPVYSVDEWMEYINTDDGQKYMAENVVSDVNAAQAIYTLYKGKGGKAKGKGKGTFKGQCWECGEYGHRSFDPACPKFKN